MKHISIRTQLFALVTAVAVPLIALLAYTIYSNARQTVAEVKNNAHVLTVIAASDVARVLAANRDVLKQMAKRPIIRAVDRKHCDPVLWDFLGLFPKSANMTVIDLEGTAICSAVPQPGGKPVSIAKAEWFKRSQETDGFVVSKPFFGPITGRWVTVLTYPIHDDAEKKIGYLGLPLDLALYVPNLSGAPLFPGTSVGIVTADMKMVWRNIEPEKWVGKDISDLAVARQLVAMRSGQAEGVGLDGVSRFYAITPIEGVDWFVFVGIPSDSVYSGVRASMLRNILLGGASLLALMGVALLIARRIEKPVQELAAAARAVKNGNKEIRVRLEGAPEIVDVAEEFNEMLDVQLLAEAAMMKSEIALSEALRIAHLGYWEYDVASDNFIFNDQYYALHRTTAAAMGGYQMSSADFTRRLVYPEDAPEVGRYIQKALDAQDAGFFAETESRIMCVDGEMRWVQVRFKIEKDPQGKTIRLIGANQDITERKKAELELRSFKEMLETRVKERTAQLEAANSELEAFSYSVSHDLRSPLRAIDGFSHILQEEYGGKLDEEGRRLLEVVRDNTDRMGQLIDDMLQFSRTGRMELSLNEIDMNRMVRQAMEEICSDSGCSGVEFQVADLPPAHGDSAMIRQVMLNLLSNALKFSRGQAAPRIEVGASEGGDEVIYHVKDNGVGFDMQFADKLFGVFQRLHSVNEFEGTGIGLAIVKRIITRHGGRVWAEGKVGKGAAFYFALPSSR